jgi:Uma2 family endonuclease
MLTNASLITHWSELVSDIGNVPSNRIVHVPAPGRATIEDAVRLNNLGHKCELVDGTLVEKAMGWQESLIAAVLIEILGGFVREKNLGVVVGADGFIELFPSLVRAPDVSFFSWSRLPDNRIPDAPIPSIVPDLAIEVLSLGNTRAEMARKMREYFHAGVRLVWMVDVRARTVAVYTSPTAVQVYAEADGLEAFGVLPGLMVDLKLVFGELDRRCP